MSDLNEGEAAGLWALGAGSGRAVLLLHGQPGTGGDWAPVTGRLAPSHRVLAPDRPGWGRSRGPAGGFDLNAGAMARLLQTTGAWPAVVVGHSFGGGVALRLATAHPRLVRALVLVAPVGSTRSIGALDRLLARPVAGEVLARLGAKAAAGAAHLGGRAPGKEEALARLGAEAVARDSFVAEQRALVSEIGGVERDLGAVRAPTVVVSARHDYVVPWAAARAVAEAIPGAELLTVPGHRHMLAWYEPDLVAATVARYAS